LQFALIGAEQQSFATSKKGHELPPPYSITSSASCWSYPDTSNRVTAWCSTVLGCHAARRLTAREARIADRPWSTRRSIRAQSSVASLARHCVRRFRRNCRLPL